MIERLTDRARRALFFARYETTQLGGQCIEAEHLLLGVVREARGAARELLTRGGIDLDVLRRTIAERRSGDAHISTAIEIPFSGETRRVMAAAAAEADALAHSYIGPEHLLLGLLRESATSGQLIEGEHLNLDIARQWVARATGGESRGT